MFPNQKEAPKDRLFSSKCAATAFSCSGSGEEVSSWGGYPQHEGKPWHLAQGLRCFGSECPGREWGMMLKERMCSISLHTQNCSAFLAILSLSALSHRRGKRLTKPSEVLWGSLGHTVGMQERSSLTSSGEFRSSKSSSILSTNSSVNRICKGNTVVYVFSLLVLANCQATEWLFHWASCTRNVLHSCNTSA